MAIPAEIKQGSTFTLRKDPVTTRQLVMYAGASGDYNPIHYDLRHAESAGLGGVIAHGMLTMGFAGQCLTDWAGPRAKIREFSGRFLTPVRPGDEVEMTGTVDQVSETADIDLTVTGTVGEKTVFSGKARLNLDLPS